MASITYIGIEAGEDGFIRWMGHAFERNRPVETDHPGLIDAAKGNPFFEVSGADPKPAEDDQDGEEEDLDGFKIVPVGKGWFKIVDPEGLDTEGKFRKSDAETKVVELAAARV